MFLLLPSTPDCRFRCLFPASAPRTADSDASDPYFKASDADSFEFDAESVDSDADTNSSDSNADAASSDGLLTFSQIARIASALFFRTLWV